MVRVKPEGRHDGGPRRRRPVAPDGSSSDTHFEDMLGTPDGGELDMKRVQEIMRRVDVELGRLRAKERAFVKENNVDEEAAKKFKWFNRFLILFFLILCALYTTYIIFQYLEDRENPKQSIASEAAPSTGLAYPAITMCHYTPGLPLDVLYVGHETNRQSRDLTDRVLRFANATDEEETTCVAMNTVLAHAGDPIRALGTGSTDSLDVVVDLRLDAAGNDTLALGAMLVLKPFQFTAYTEALMAEITHFAPPGFVTILNLQRVVATDIDGDQREYWETTQSMMRLSNNPLLGSNSVAVVSLRYSTLDTRLTTEDYSFSLLSASGEVAGMLGTILGLDVLGLVLMGQVLLIKARLRNKQALAQEIQAANDTDAAHDGAGSLAGDGGVGDGAAYDMPSEGGGGGSDGIV